MKSRSVMGIRASVMVTGLMLLVASSGCATWRAKVPGWDKLTGKSSQPDGKVPDKIVAVWSDTVYYQAGSTPTRGLGGRIFFYDERERPVTVNGQLVVYAFEDQLGDGELTAENATDESVEPVKKFLFTAEQLVKHYSPSEFGPSYSFWLPWDQLGSEAKAVSVLPVFADASGKLVMGQEGRHRLTGKQPSPTAQAKLDSTTSESSPSKLELTTDGARQMRVTTIAHRGANSLSSTMVGAPASPLATTSDPSQWVQKTSYTSPTSVQQTTPSPKAAASVPARVSAASDSVAPPARTDLPNSQAADLPALGTLETPADVVDDESLSDRTAFERRRTLARRPIRPTDDPHWRNAPRFNRSAQSPQPIHRLPTE